MTRSSEMQALALPPLIKFEGKMNELEYFPEFANNCEYVEDEGHTFGCTNPDNLGGGCCFDAACPLVVLPSLADLKRLDSDLYEEWKREYPGAKADDESELIPANYGCEWVILREEK